MPGSGCLASHGVNTILKKTGFPTGVENMGGALHNLMGGGELESLHGGLKLVLTNTACEGLHSLVKLPAIKKNNKKNKLYGPFLWMGFNCLKARATSRRQFTFYH